MAQGEPTRRGKSAAAVAAYLAESGHVFARQNVRAGQWRLVCSCGYQVNTAGELASLDAYVLRHIERVAPHTFRALCEGSPVE